MFLRAHALLLASLLVVGCSSSAGDTKRDAAVNDLASDVDALCPDPDGDDDGDGIPNRVEGCLESRDTDGDGTPDWQDLDSDDDGIPDAIEKGEPGACIGKQKDRWPCDSDSDGWPDYIDIDADGDGILDKNEDINGDGLLGCCLARCGVLEGAQKPHDGLPGCPLNPEGCGERQRCVNGACVPPVDFGCANGETSPRFKDTFGSGCFDNEPCDWTPCSHYHKSVLQHASSDPALDPQSGDWQLALDLDAQYRAIAISNAPPKVAAAAIDYPQGQHLVAGFVLSLPDGSGDLRRELAALLARLAAQPPGGGVGSVTLQASGIAGKSHDRFDAIYDTTLALSLSSNADAATVRNQLIATLLGRPQTDLQNLPPPFVSASGQQFALRLFTLRRYAFQKDVNLNEVLDADGYPIEDLTRPEARRIIVLGALALQTHDQDPSRTTAFLVRDLASGGALARYGSTLTRACDVGTITTLPVLDIIWVIDESPSLARTRQQLASHSNDLYSGLLSAGVDFRMAVTNALAPNAAGAAGDARIGKFCSTVSTDPNDDGGNDRFQFPTEQATFEACLQNPPGFGHDAPHLLENAVQALAKHLPRASNQPEKIRPDAEVVVILVTDGETAELESLLGPEEPSTACRWNDKQATARALALQPYTNFFAGASNPETRASLHLIGGVCANRCGAAVAPGLRELTQLHQGQTGDICQKDLGTTLQAIVESTRWSPIALDARPIASSLSLALDGVRVERSRTSGFDYRAAQNALVLTNVKFDKGYEVVVGYWRWQD